MLSIIALCLKCGTDKELALFIASLAAAQSVESIGNKMSVNKVQILTKDGISLLSWLVKGKGKTPLLVYFHGNSFDIGERAYRIKRYIDQIGLYY